MHPELEDFLNRAFGSLEATSPKIGRVVVEPDYDAQPEEREGSVAAEQLRDCVAREALAEEALAARDGLEVKIRNEYGLLRKYVRSIRLHANAVEGSWVEIAPPGNWI